MKRFDNLTIDCVDDLVFGSCPNPVRLTPEIVVGAGETIPEVNYTLPYGTAVNESTLDGIVDLYRKMATQSLERGEALGCRKQVIEIELVFELTLNPEWGERVIAATREAIDALAPKGVHAALRTTVADIRDRKRPPRNRTSDETALMFESFERCAPYSDILSIESTGGKEVSDDAILHCDPGGVLFALGDLACRDMEFVWARVVEICAKHGKVAGGDAACGFANTAMQLAGKRMIPTIFAAVVRAIGAARSLVALECGATGPDKDCAYEGPILKAIAGIPISMEGKSAACAHSSPIGNVAMCCCDLWSNESVPYTNLFGGFTPEVCIEQLWYDCKLMNKAIERDQAVTVRDLLSESDAQISAEALVLAPESCIRIARAIVSGGDYAQRCENAAREALAIIEEGVQNGALRIPEMEGAWLGMLRQGIDQYASLEGGRIGHYTGLYQDKFIPSEYGLE